MRVAGIIAEYNPFHNGHQYHIEQTRHITGADYVIVVMSGNYVQRGAPALINKYARTKMALSCGADLVLELPLYYACSSAEYFAKGAISLLTKLGVVDSLCFGSECGDIATLSQIAQALANPTPQFTTHLKTYLKNGEPFPKARMLALSEAYPALFVQQEAFSAPNNILGIEYIKALMTQNSPIRPYTMTRQGSAYHAANLTSNYSSAKAIREALLSGFSLSSLKKQLPESVLKLISEHAAYDFPIFQNDLSSLLHYKLLLDSAVGYTAYADVTNDFSDRIQNHLNAYTDFTSFCELLKTKELTHTRISRCLLHILLQMTEEHMQTYLANGITPYARMLGFRKSATPLLSAIKRDSSIPLLSKLANVKDTLTTEQAYAMLEEDIRASHMYNALTASKYQAPFINEYSRQLIICP